jgi:hypothetical protein
VATKKKEVTKTEKPSNLFRALSSVFLINSASFAKLAASTQTSTLGKAGEKPIKFVTDFVGLSNKKTIREALLDGKDVSMELEFNGVSLDESELATLKAVGPVLKKISGIGPSYPWLPEITDCSLQFTENSIKKGGNSLAKSTAKAIWNKASKYWSGGTKPTSHMHGGDYYRRGNEVRYTPEGVLVGCQRATRGEVEAMARHYGWEPVVAE